MGQCEPDYAGRDKALDAFAEYRAVTVQCLRQYARNLWNKTRQPVSTNDVRHLLPFMQYDGDPRILGATFSRKEWKPVGWTTVSGGKAHARPIRTFVPRDADAP